LKKKFLTNSPQRVSKEAEFCAGSFDTLSAKLKKKILFNPYKGRCYFFGFIILKRLFYKLVVGFQGQSISHEASESRKITGPY
jgi:hypothetical protein